MRGVVGVESRAGGVVLLGDFSPCFEDQSKEGPTLMERYMRLSSRAEKTSASTVLVADRTNSFMVILTCCV